jgi:hypothetical protein
VDAVNENNTGGKGAREWWVPDGYQFDDKHSCEKAFVERPIHVIEYSYFESQVSTALDEIEKLRAENEQLRKNKSGMACSNCGEQYFNFNGAQVYEENAKLKEENERLKASDLPNVIMERENLWLENAKLKLIAESYRAILLKLVQLHDDEDHPLKVHSAKSAAARANAWNEAREALTAQEKK